MANKSLDVNKLPLQRKDLYQPSLQEIASILSTGLHSNFEHVDVEVVDSPDLTKAPFHLAKEGLNGSTKLVEVGGPPYLLPLVQRDKLYDLVDVANLIKSENCLFIGAGAGPHPFSVVNCEGIFNMNVVNGKVDKQFSRISRVDLQDGNPIQEQLPTSETRCALLGNFFVSEGKPGKVLKVHAKKRIGKDDFITSIRNVLSKKYEDKLVGLGGTFLLKEGKAKQHVMRDFSKTPINTDEEVNQWLKFYEMPAPLVAVGTFVTSDGDLDLRLQHYHSFSNHGLAGHYHIDVTPEEVEYLGYFNTGSEIYRIDRPEQTHLLGRD